MARRTITHFKVSAALFNDLTALLFELPAKASRELLNRIDNRNGDECEPIFKVELKPPAKKKTKRRVRKPPVVRKKVAKHPRRS